MKKKIIVGGVYLHTSGIRYRIDKLLLNATGYEKTPNLTKAVLYTQLDDGKYPQGTQWVRSEEDFLKVFKWVKEESE